MPEHPPAAASMLPRTVLHLFRTILGGRPNPASNSLSDTRLGPIARLRRRRRCHNYNTSSFLPRLRRGTAPLRGLLHDFPPDCVYPILGQDFRLWMPLMRHEATSRISRLPQQGRKWSTGHKILLWAKWSQRDARASTAVVVAAANCETHTSWMSAATRASVAACATLRKPAKPRDRSVVFCAAVGSS